MRWWTVLVDPLLLGLDADGAYCLMRHSLGHCEVVEDLVVLVCSRRHREPIIHLPAIDASRMQALTREILFQVVWHPLVGDFVDLEPERPCRVSFHDDKRELPELCHRLGLSQNRLLR